MTIRDNFVLKTISIFALSLIFVLFANSSANASCPYSECLNGIIIPDEKKLKSEDLKICEHSRDIARPERREIIWRRCICNTFTRYEALAND